MAFAGALSTVEWPGPPEPPPVGSPPWITKPGTIGGKNVSSKKPRFAREARDPAAFGATFWFSVTVNEPQFVSKTRRYVLPASSFRCSFESDRSCLVVCACVQPPVAACVVVLCVVVVGGALSLEPPPQPASARTITASAVRLTSGVLQLRLARAGRARRGSSPCTPSREAASDRRARATGSA